jgi:hypothetical protein
MIALKGRIERGVDLDIVGEDGGTTEASSEEVLSVCETLLAAHDDWRGKV